MKTKIKILIVSCMIATAAITGFNFAQNGSNIDVSLADIAVMAKADPESGGSCMSWGYKSWGHWLSGSDGVDCNCTDREKVWSSCQ